MVVKKKVQWNEMKMILMEWLFLLSVIPAIEGSLRLGKPKGSSAAEKVTKKILETCYGDNDSKDLIFIIGNFNEFFDIAPVIRMNDVLSVHEVPRRKSYWSTRLTKVILIMESPKKLQSELKLFSQMIWWNYMLPFFIIEKNDEKCKNFKEILDMTWAKNIINLIYICSESENTNLYTLNPITDYAPDPWKRMEGLNNSKIYHQIFNPHISCNSLYYDKTKMLNGYQISIDAASCEDITRMQKPICRLFHLIIRQLNATMMSEHRSATIKHDYADIWHVPLFRKYSKEFSRLFPIEDTLPVILVKFNEQTVLHKIRHLWSTQVLCMAVIALTILFFTLVMKNGEVTSAILDIIRFLTYLSIQIDTRSNSFRIYFATMLVFIVISNGVFQGKIASFLTKPDKVPLFKTVEELHASRHIVYLHDSLWARRLGLHASDLIIVDNDDACIDYVLNGTHDACVIPLFVYEQKHLLKPLYRVRPQFDILYPIRWISRQHWPLYERFNYMLMLFIESGIWVNLENELYYNMTHKRKADDHELALAEIVPPYRPIELVKLDFAFNLLAIGLSFATLVLIIELRMREI